MSINEVPPPPQPFPAGPILEVVPAGSVMHRVHSKDYGGDQFISAPKVIFRFSPIWHRGHLIPTWYAGKTQACAFYESIFHDAASLGADRFVKWSYLLTRRYSAWCTTRDLTLVSFKASALTSLHITIDQLTATDPQYYPQTARWTEAVYAALPDIDGIVWNSCRSNGEDAYLLFGEPRTRSVLTPHGAAPVPVLEDDACIELLNACLDCTKIDISEHPDSTPTNEIKRVPKKTPSV